MMERFTYRGLRQEYVAPCALLADITIQIGSEPEPVKINSAIKKTLNHKPNPEVMCVHTFSNQRDELPIDELPIDELPKDELPKDDLPKTNYP